MKKFDRLPPEQRKEGMRLRNRYYAARVEETAALIHRCGAESLLSADPEMLARLTDLMNAAVLSLHILSDKKALELKPKLPQRVKDRDKQGQYTLMASAVRSTNMDRYIQDFMQRKPNGIVVNLGCGLETTFFRNDNGKTLWYEVDLPEVIAYRRELLGESDRDRCIAGDGFSKEWMEEIRKDHPTEPILVTASGLFYYFEREKVLDLFALLATYGEVEMVFDAVNSSGMKQMGKYMEQVGHADALMYFYVDSAKDVAEEVGGTVLAEEPYYAHTPKKGMQFMTSVSMKVSDKFMMVKMIHLKLN